MWNIAISISIKDVDSMQIDQLRTLEGLIGYSVNPVIGLSLAPTNHKITFDSGLILYLIESNFKGLFWIDFTLNSRTSTLIKSHSYYTEYSLFLSILRFSFSFNFPFYAPNFFNYPYYAKDNNDKKS